MHSPDSKQKLVDVFWKTVTMCHNFELFGDYVILGMMTRAINMVLWQHIVVTIPDESMYIYLTGEDEGIMCGFWVGVDWSF